MRNTPNRKTGLSPDEILKGRAMRLPAVPANALVNITYCKGLADVVCSFSHQVEATALQLSQDHGHNLRKSRGLGCDQKAREEDMFLVSMEGSLPGSADGYHNCEVRCSSKLDQASHTRKVACPLDNEEELLRVPTTSRPTPELERGQGETETDSEQTESGSATPVRDQGEDPRESEPTSTEAAGESSQRRALPEADGLERQTEQTTDPEGERVEADQRQCGRTPPEPVASLSRESPAEQREITSPTLKRPLTKGPLKGDKWPKSQAKRKETITMITIEEEVDTTRKEDLSVGELKEIKD
ncbi:hypothetical protein NDU88_003453 [Pleurodeles waltl]|uniref:Uncharacterized protein n=1 Tax=Pleurodeles waltl TaxID=8319 RepID=A0AAV7W3K6_PLEWA|nr:hypothetical protein NDU88_003453 [Pleurodeles waltl]